MTQSPQGALLHMQGIYKSFGGISALSDGELFIHPGEVHALIGQNGAGKSTMVKVLNGAYSRDKGTINFDGREVTFTSPHHAQQGGVSTIFQEVNLVGYRSVTENIVLGQEPKKWGMIDWEKAHQMAKSAVERFGLDIDVSQPLNSYNIAIQQLIAIARAVSFNAKLVIMDEPTSSLDDGETEVLFSVIRDLKAQGVAILYISHHLDELFAVCDSVTIMRDGKTIGRHPISEVTKLDLVSKMIGRNVDEISGLGQTGFGTSVERHGEVILEVEALSCGNSLRDASFVLHQGEIVGLAGLLGAGRSELTRALFGADVADGGVVKFEDKSTKFTSPKQAIKSGVGLCTEDRKIDGIIPQLSVRENATLAMLPALSRHGVIARQDERALVDEYMDRLKIKASTIEQPISELSGGNQQKVLLARWLAVEPHILMLDEPTRGIDVGAKREIQRLIFELAQKGMSIIMVSSEFEELIEGADRVVVLQAGRTVAELDKAELSEEALLQAVSQDGAVEAAE